MALVVKVGKEMTVSIGTDVIAMAKDFSLEVNKETIDITTLDDQSWKQFLVDLKEWKISCSGLVTRGTEGTNEIGSEAILADLISNDAAVTLTMTSSVSGAQYVSGSAFLISYKEDAKVGDAVSFSCDFQGTGALTPATVGA